MDALLKRREELIRAKQEIERKLKLAGKVKGKGDKIKTLTTINEDETNDNATEFAEPRNDSIILDMKWDNKTGKLAVLQPQTLQIKSLKNSDTTRTNLVLPETADKDTELVLENGAIGLCYKTRSYIYQNDKWQELDNDQKLISSSTNTVTLNRAVKKIQIFKCDEVLHEIDDVEIVFKSEDVSSHKDNILILKSDGSLTFWLAHIILFNTSYSLFVVTCGHSMKQSTSLIPSHPINLHSAPNTSFITITTLTLPSF